MVSTVRKTYTDNVAQHHDVGAFEFGQRHGYPEIFLVVIISANRVKDSAQRVSGYPKCPASYSMIHGRVPAIVGLTSVYGARSITHCERKRIKDNAMILLNDHSYVWGNVPSCHPESSG